MIDMMKRVAKLTRKGLLLCNWHFFYSALVFVPCKSYCADFSHLIRVGQKKDNNFDFF
jgi:hypothetical protein